MHFSQWLIWSINLSWASKLIQRPFSDEKNEMYLNLLMWWGGRHKHVKFGHCMPMSSRSWPAKNCEGTRASAKKKGLYRWCLKLQHPSSKKLWWVSSTFHTLLFLLSILWWNPWSNRKAIICRLDSLVVAGNPDPNRMLFFLKSL